jgi:ABC-2 type transport system ATP-binding protein
VTAVVEIRGLRVVFGAVVGVDQLDLTVRSGAAVALVGRNGAGKSTTLRAVAGVIPPTSGSIRVRGVCSTTDPTTVRGLVGYCPDTGGLIPRATPWEHLQLAAKLHSFPEGSWERRAGDLLHQFDLLGAADRVTAGFSHGMGRRMSVVLAAFSEPEALLLDEPFDGVDPLGIEATMAVIAQARARGAAVVVSTHLLPLAVDSCEEVLVLRQGRIVGASPAEEMAGQAGAERYRALLS